MLLYDVPKLYAMHTDPISTVTSRPSWQVAAAIMLSVRMVVACFMMVSDCDEGVFGYCSRIETYKSVQLLGTGSLAHADTRKRHRV